MEQTRWARVRQARRDAARYLRFARTLGATIRRMPNRLVYYPTGFQARMMIDPKEA